MIVAEEREEGENGRFEASGGLVFPPAIDFLPFDNHELAATQTSLAISFGNTTKEDLRVASVGLVL